MVALAQRLSLVCALVLLASPAWGAIAKTNQSVDRCTSACTTRTTAHNTPAGTDRLMIIDVPWFNSAGISITSVTSDGSPAVNVGNASGSCGAGICGVSKWKLVAPNEGANSVVVNASGSANIVVIVSTYDGVDQTTPTGTPQSSTGTSNAPTLGFTSDSGELIQGVLAIMNAGSSPAPSGGGTMLAAQYDIGGFIHGAASFMTGATSVTYGWTYGTAQPFAMLAVPILPSGTGGGGGSFFSELLLWNDNSTNEDRFRLQWKHATQPTYTDLAVLPANQTSFLVQYTTELDRCYRNRSENDGGNSAFSNELCSSTSASGPILLPLPAPFLGGGLFDAF